MAEQIPAAMFHLGVGSIAEGHTCGAHNPKMMVDESVLYRGAALYAYCAARYLGRAPGLIPGPLCIRHTAPGQPSPI